MTIASRVAFFDLPSEIRNEIYFLVVYHHETDGIISPLGGKHHPREISIGLLDHRRYPIKQRQRYYAVNATTPAEKLELEKFKVTSNFKSKHFCTEKCLRPRSGISRTCRQLREEVLPVFYSIHTFHFEMSNFEITDPDGLPVRSWSPVRWWRAIGDTNLRRIATLNLVCHPTSKELKEATVMFRSRWVGREIEVSMERTGQLAWEKVRRANMGQPSNNTPASRHPLDMTRFESYRLRKWARGSDFEAAVEPLLKPLQTSGLHVRALEQLVAALEPWDVEYLRDHISLGDPELVVGNVKEGRGELALKWDFLS
jgi:hypothetical protein